MPQPTYRKVKDVYDKLHEAGVVTQTLPEWSAQMNQETGTELFSAGLHDNFIKRASVGIDRLLEKTPLPEIGRDIGGQYGTLFGAQEQGTAIGEKLPRSALNMASFLIPGAGWANAARLGIAGLMSGAETYTETGSPAAGTLTGLTTAVLPGVAGAAERAVASRGVGKLGTFLTGQGAAAGLMEGSEFGQDVIANRELHNPFKVDTLLNLTLGQVPFAGIHGVNKLLGRGTISPEVVQHATEKSNELARLKEASQLTPLSTEPPSPEVVRETQARLAKIRGEQVAIKNDPTIPDEQKVERLNLALQEEQNTLRQHTAVPDSVFGDSIQADSPRQQVVGRELKSTSKWRAIEVADLPVNPEELRGKVVTYSTAYEPNPKVRSTGVVFGLPDPQWRTIKTAEEWSGRFAKKPDGTLELPVGKAVTDAQIWSHLQDLRKVETEVDTAQSPADMQQAVTRLQSVQHENNLPPTNDTTLRKTAERLQKAGVETDVVKTAVKVEAKRTERKVKATRELEREVPPLTEQEAAKISAMMGEGGFSVVTADKLSHKTTDELASLPKDETGEPLHNIVEEAAYTVTQGAVATKSDDVSLFRMLVGEFGSLKDVEPQDVQDVLQTIRGDLSLVEAKDEVMNFLSKPHVKEWTQKLEDHLNRVRETNSEPGQSVRPPPGERLVTVRKADGTSFQASFGDKYYEGNRASVARLTPEGKWSHTVLGEGDRIIEPIKTGVGWLFSLAPYDPVRNMLGGKHTLPKTGVVTEASLRNIGGSAGKPLTVAEIELYRTIVPKAFSEAGVNVPKLVEGLKEKGPTVEVRKLGGTIPERVSEELSRLRHELDTDLGPGWHNQDLDSPEFQRFPRLQQEQIRRVVALESEGVHTGEVDVGGPRYSFLGPKPESEMPGYVEGLVRVPVKRREDAIAALWEAQGEPENMDGPTILPGGSHGEIKYSGPHFGSEDTNVLSFFRGYEETLLDGTKAFHMIEVQSDWGQKNRELKQQYQRDPDQGEAAVKNLGAPSHPLLHVYESLALKATIQHAKEVGATKVILSDAETAMMTEGHDRVARRGDFEREIPQEKGMRLHYDQTLPSAMEKLTGEKGEMVEVGVHKTAIPHETLEAGEYGQGSPVFRDATGSPKTQITGRLYDISHLPSDFTLTEPNRAPQIEPLNWDLITEGERLSAEQLGLERGGLGLHEFLGRSTNPIVKSVFEGLKPFTDVLGRVEVVLGDTKSGVAATYDIGNGKTRIVLPPSILGSSIADFTAAHELVHGVTISELNNPTKVEIVRQFDDMRNRLIEALPEKLQIRLNELVKSDWKSKYATGEAPWDSIYDGTLNEKTLLYSLLNTKEMVAQGMSSRHVQNFMRSVKVEKGNWFSRFTETVKNLLGIKSDGTLFEEFLTKTNQLLEHGDYVSSFREFSERYFENLGMSENMALGQTRRALGVVLDSGFDTTKSDIISRLMSDVGVRSQEVFSTKRDLNNFANEKGEDFINMEQVMGELGYESSTKGTEDFLHDVLNGEVSRYHDALDMLPTEASRYVFAKIRDMKDVLGVLKAATNESNKGLLNLANPTALRGSIRDTITVLERIVEVEKVHDLGRQLVQEAIAMAPDTFVVRAENSSKVLENFGNEDMKKPGPLSTFFTQAGRMARRFPVTAELVDRVYELGPNAANMKGNILKILGVDVKAQGQALSREGLAGAVKAISTPRTLNAVNKWMYWNNEIARRENRGVTLLQDSHPEVAKVLQGLTPAERDGVIDTVAKQAISTQVAQSEVLEKMHKIGVTVGANIPMKDRGYKTTEALHIADDLFNALRVDRTNPQLAQQADAQMSVVQSKMTPEGFLELLKHTQMEVEKFGLWETYFKENPAWATAQRLERFLVSFVRGNQKKQLQASSVKEAKSLSEGGKHVEIVDQWKGKENDFPVQDIGPVIARVAELEENQLRIARSKGYIDEEGFAGLQQYSAATQLARENAVGTGGVPKFQAPPRLLSQGAADLPWFWNHVAHAERVGNFWSRKLLRAQATLHLADSDITATPEVRDWAKQHVENVLQTDPALTQKIARFTSTWFMGFSPASAMMNGFQTVTTAVPEMTLINGGRPLDSYAKWGRAVTEVSKESLPNGKWTSDDHKWFAKQMSEAHEWAFSMYSDEAYTQEAAATDFKRIMMKQKPTTVGQKLSTATGMYSNVGMWMFKSVERFNNKVASVMAFDHYMGEGMSREDALVEAKRFNRAVNYTGGRANRPTGIFDNKGNFSRSLAILATNMQGYNLGVVGQIADYVQRGFFRPPGITPAEVYASRKAGIQMMATQLVAAGALGLPFVSGTLALLNTLFPDLEINRHVREWAKNFFDGDHENGNIYGDIALTGLPSMIGWDMQSRLSMGNIVPGVSEYNGFQPKLLLGPPVNMVSNFVNGTMKLAQGNPQGGEAFVPPGVRKLFQYVSNEGQIKDYKDRPLFTPTVGETAGIALGFQPKRLTDFNTANRLAEQNRTVTNRREGQWNQQQAEEALRGNFGTVRQVLLERQQQDKNYNVSNAVHSIAQNAEELTFPRDLRREGTTSTGTIRNQLLSSFNLSPTDPSEVDRLNFRSGIEQRLGMPPSRNRRELWIAQSMDALKAQNPSLTRSQLRQMVEQQLRGSARTGALLQALQE